MAEIGFAALNLARSPLNRGGEWPPVEDSFERLRITSGLSCLQDIPRSWPAIHMTRSHVFLRIQMFRAFLRQPDEGQHRRFSSNYFANYFDAYFLTLHYLQVELTQSLDIPGPRKLTTA